MYSEKIRETFLNEFLYGNKSAIDVLQEIDDITKIYHISLNGDSYIGLIFIIVISFLSFIILFSSIFYFIDRFIPFFDFLSFDFWIITLIGDIIIIMTSLTEYGVITVTKCQIRLIMLSLGVTFNITPTLQKLIANFPEENKLSTWVIKYKYLFFLLFIMMEIILNGLMFIDPYSVETDIVFMNKISIFVMQEILLQNL